jgi:type IV fimbrial biogenesis protein FimT
MPGRWRRGFTLIELLVTLVVLAILGAAAAPFMGDMVLNARLSSGGSLLYTQALMAQSEAVKRNFISYISISGQTVTMGELTPPVLGASSELKPMSTRTLAGAVTATEATFVFDAEGRPFPFGTEVSIDLGAEGVTCSADIRCPGLRISAGGAIRLCANHLVDCP